jgi:hypothetical protein
VPPKFLPANSNSPTRRQRTFPSGFIKSARRDRSDAVHRIVTRFHAPDAAGTAINFFAKEKAAQREVL